jgi:hypothetical protein
MTDQSAIDDAARRLMQALDQLEAAVDRGLEAERGRAILAEQVHALDSDRAKLASDLDAQLGRARRLETANRDVARRLDAAMESIQSVLDAKG